MVQLQLSQLSCSVDSDGFHYDQRQLAREASFESSASSWDDRQDDAHLKQQQNGKYSQLRVVVPDSSNCFDGAISPTGTVSGPSTPGTNYYGAAFVGGLLTGRQYVSSAADAQQHSGFGPSSTKSTARRLLSCDSCDRKDVSMWLDQQISTRQSARATLNIDGPVELADLSPKEYEGAAGVSRMTASRAGLPAPAFQLLGLL